MSADPHTLTVYGRPAFRFGRYPAPRARVARCPPCRRRTHVVSLGARGRLHRVLAAAPLHAPLPSPLQLSAAYTSLGHLGCY
ncbi:hypothetical protein OAO87_04455 [bacterium]|nr:hypothetical protein [bacterium]